MDITTDYVVGDGLTLSSPVGRLNRFIQAFWHHPLNQLGLRLEAMCDELTRAGDLFVVLFRNEQDGMSYLRLVPKDAITRIETAENDWETEVAFYEAVSGQPSAVSGQSPVANLQSPDERRWLSPHHPQAAESAAVMVHYAINRPVGALLGEGDLATLTPWLLRYSRMLEDRVRLHWAMRAFLWVVTVPTNRVEAKREQYRTPPESGSLVIKDADESWEAVTPTLHASDAQHDLKAVRGMIDAGSGFPPHWRGEAADANLATATAMQSPTERHLRRRQHYFVHMLEDIVYQAYLRAWQVGQVGQPPPPDYSAIFTANVPDLSRADNAALAQAGKDLAEAHATLAGQLPGRSPRLNRLMVQTLFKFIGEPLRDEVVDEIMEEGMRDEG